jgi:hypothetical protein
MDTAPLDGTVIKIKDWRNHEYYAFYEVQDCSGMCSPPGVAPHDWHKHEYWLLCEGTGEQLYSGDSFQITVTPTHWMPIPKAPEVSE